jgi:hypothetical protein
MKHNKNGLHDGPIKLHTEDKVIPVHAMKEYRGRRGTTPLILNLGTR